MPAEPQQGTSDQTAGLVLSGNFLSGKVQTGKDDGKGGRWPDRFIVTILAGDRTIQVEYPSQAAAEAVGALGERGEPMEPVRIPVGVRAAKGYVFYFGRR